MSSTLTSPAQRAPAAAPAPPSPRTAALRASTDSVPQVARVNRNAEWVSTPGGWAFISGLLVLTWLAASALVGPGPAATVTHLAHGAASYYLLHWMKGSPVQADQGKYDGLTFWEQVREERKRGEAAGSPRSSLAHTSSSSSTMACKTRRRANS